MLPRERLQALRRRRAAGGVVALSSSTERHSIRSGGRVRLYLVDVPRVLDPSSPAPCVLNLHGLGATAAQQAAYSGLGPKGAARGFVVITPQGIGRVPRWRIPAISGDDDVRFLADALDDVARRVPLDPGRVHATGISNGAVLLMMLPRYLGRPLAAIAPVAGLNAVRVWDGAPPLSVIAFHGTEDPIVPYTGGHYFQGPRPGAGSAVGGPALQRFFGNLGGGRGNPKLQALAVEQSLADWARHNGCADRPTETRVGTDVRHIAYPGCASGAAVELYAVIGGGHTWPGGPTLPVPALGVTSHTIDASTLMLDFFERVGARPAGS